MRKFFVALLVGLCLSGAFAGGYKKPVVVKEMNFTASYEGGKVYFTWSRYLRDDFLYYKLVKSKTNADPVYPDDGYIFYGEQDAKSWVEESPEAGTWYYRLCIITQNGDRWVSPVIKVTISGQASGVPTAKDFAP